MWATEKIFWFLRHQIVTEYCSSSTHFATGQWYSAKKLFVFNFNKFRQQVCSALLFIYFHERELTCPNSKKLDAGKNVKLCPSVPPCLFRYTVCVHFKQKSICAPLFPKAFFQNEKTASEKSDLSMHISRLRLWL